MKKVLIILILFILILPSFAFLQQPQITSPETLEKTKEIGEKVLQVGEKELPGIIEKTWQEEILPIWQKMWDWFKANIWSRVENWIRPEIEKRKEILKEGFEGEKEEMKEELKTEVPKTGKSLWEKFKELIR